MKRYIKASVVNISDMPLEDLMELASDHKTPPETLEKIATVLNRSNILSYIDLAKDIIANPNTPHSVLEWFATKFYNVKQITQRLAKNSNASPTTLATLSKSELLTRCFVAENPNTPIATLKQLAQPEEDADVRYGVACNKNLSKDLVDILVNDPNPDIRSELADKTDLPIDLVQYILHSLVDDSDRLVRYSVALNVHCPTELLHTLSIDADSLVRQAVAVHQNTSNEDLIELAKDSDIHVTGSAKQSLRIRGVRV